LQIEGGNAEKGLIEKLYSSLPHLEEISFYMTRNLTEADIKKLAETCSKLQRLTFFHTTDYSGLGLSSPP
jgi:hypothetical protein